MSKFPVIVLDGPDGVGKTTLSKELCQTLGAQYVHLTYRWPARMFDYHTAALFYVLRQAEKHPVVLDRWWPSEIAYANVYRGGTKWPLAKRLFEKAALLHGFTYVFCYPNDRQAYLEHYERLKGERAEMYIDKMGLVLDQFIEISALLWDARDNGVLFYDFFKQGGNLKEVCQGIIEEAEDHRQTTPGHWFDNGFMNITGSFNQAKYLFVGDELKPKTRREVWPFFEYGNSSQFLAEALENIGLPEQDLMFMNASYREQRQTVSIMKEISCTKIKIIALGYQAERFLTAEGLKHGYISHPQYYRRFNRDKITTDLKEAIKW